MTDYIVILTTIGSLEEAQTIAHHLVEKHMAACVNVIPGVQSTYHWKGKVCTDIETLLVVKTITAQEKQVYETVKTLHSYDLPELITLPIVQGDEAYLNWLNDTFKTV